MSNTRNDLKGRRAENPWAGHEDRIKGPYDKGLHLVLILGLKWQAKFTIVCKPAIFLEIKETILQQ